MLTIIKAYKDDDRDTAAAIGSMLYDAGFDFDYDAWLKNTVKNEEAWLDEMNK